MKVHFGDRIQKILTAPLLAMAALAGFHDPAAGQAAYPNRPIRLVVPFAAAGAADVVARVVAEQMSHRLGQTIVVENRTGASGNIGTQMVAAAEPDGYTLLLGFDGTMVINPHIFSKLPFDPVKDFAPIGKIGDVPLLILANPKLPANTIGELIALSKSSPSGLSYGTAGTGSTQHLMFEMLKKQTGANFTHIPYRGAAPAMTDAMGGHIPLVGAALAGSYDYIKAGKLKAIAISSAQRSKYLPDVPTLVEGGMGDMVITSWHALLAPAKTPKDIVAKLNAQLNAVLNDPAIAERLASMGSIAAPGTPEKFGEQLKSELARYRQIVKDANIKVE